MTLTGAMLGKALDAVNARGGQFDSLDNFAAGANTALRQAEVTTPQECAAFLATCIMESAWLRTTTEYLGKPGTAVRKNQDRYYPYIGRGAVQCTWKDNYAAFGKWCRKRKLLTDAAQFVDSPQSLGDRKWFWLTAVWYFDANGLWPYAKAGNFRAVSNGVNRGNPKSASPPNGWESRKKIYDVLMRYGQALVPATTRPRPTSVAVDGVIGRASTDALQFLAGTTRDGVVSGQPKSIRTTATVGEMLDEHWPTVQYGSGGSQVAVWMQREAGVTGDGVLGPVTWRAWQRLIGATPDGVPGPDTARRTQQAINARLVP